MNKKKTNPSPEKKDVAGAPKTPVAKGRGKAYLNFPIVGIVLSGTSRRATPAQNHKTKRRNEQ